MNVYDFDGTIYDGDSTKDFYFFCIKKFPKLLRYLPIQIGGLILYLFKKYDKTDFKEKFYSFLKGIDNVDVEINEFWISYEKKIKGWYLKNQRPNDVVISASPEFLLIPICEHIGVDYLIASIVNKNTGRYNGKNCYGEEKIIRFKAAYKNAKIDAFYTDSKADYPIARLAEKTYLVRGEVLLKWDCL